jgi:hypothetical protein
VAALERPGGRRLQAQAAHSARFAARHGRLERGGGAVGVRAPQMRARVPACRRAAEQCSRWVRPVREMPVWAPRAHRRRVVSVVLAGASRLRITQAGGCGRTILPGGERAYLAPEGAAPSTRLGARRGCASLTAPPPSPVWRGRKDDLARGACVHLLGVSGPLVWHRPVEICSRFAGPPVVPSTKFNNDVGRGDVVFSTKGIR